MRNPEGQVSDTPLSREQRGAPTPLSTAAGRLSHRGGTELLGIHAKATPEEIGSAFRRKALQYHPDLNKAPDADVRMKEINEAYRILADPEQRERYDAERIKQRLAEWVRREAAQKKPSGKSKWKRKKK